MTVDHKDKLTERAINVSRDAAALRDAAHAAERHDYPVEDNHHPVRTVTPPLKR